MLVRLLDWESVSLDRSLSLLSLIVKELRRQSFPSGVCISTSHFAVKMINISYVAQTLLLCNSSSGKSLYKLGPIEISLKSNFILQSFTLAYAVNYMVCFVWSYSVIVEQQFISICVCQFN